MSSTLLLKNWKEEPLSPITDDDIVSNDEVTLFPESDNRTFYQTCLDINDSNSNDDYDDDDNGNNIKLEDDLIPDEIKEEIATYMLEDIEKLIDLDELIKEEPYLLDEKILPILDEVDHLQHQHQRAIQVPISEEIKLEYIRAQQQQQQSDNTQYLLKELETVYVELAHETLTPPQSPPSQPVILTPLEPLLQQQQQQQTLIPSQHTYLPINNNDKQPNNVYPVPDDKQLLSLQGYHAIPSQQQQQQLIPMEYPIIATTPQPDIAHELAVVDELVRIRVEDMQWNINDHSSGPLSPTSNSCSGSSNFGDYSSDDPEWVPETIENCNDLSDGGDLLQLQQRSKRSKPYSRAPTTDRKSRKKEQNKNAATRYRMKKKQEAEVILGEERQLADKNEDLENKINDMQREIKYLKGLMRDLFKAKGLIN